MIIFCENCHDEVDYTTEEVQKERMIKGKKVGYMGTEAYCKVCSTPVFVPHIMDENLNRLNEAYAKA